MQYNVAGEWTGCEGGKREVAKHENQQSKNLHQIYYITLNGHGRNKALRLTSIHEQPHILPHHGGMCPVGDICDMKSTGINKTTNKIMPASKTEILPNEIHTSFLL